MLDKGILKSHIGHPITTCVFDFRSTTPATEWDGFRRCYVGYLDAFSSIRHIPPTVYQSVYLCFEI